VSTGGEEYTPLTGPRVQGQHGGCVVAYPHHLGAARQESRIQLKRVFSSRVRSLVMSLEGTIVLNTEI
jgi:hypothetical protein